MRPRQHAALAELISILSMGEDTAAATFASLAADHAPAAYDMTAISREEEGHAALVHAILKDFPSRRDDPPFRRAQRLFFLELGRSDVPARFSTIYALDSAVCVILSAARRSHAVARELHLAATLKQIHRDEARHVRVSRDWARQLSCSEDMRSRIHLTRHGLIDLLRRREDDLAEIGLDVDDLFGRLRPA